jgi:hypothetical protein
MRRRRGRSQQRRRWLCKAWVDGWLTEDLLSGPCLHPLESRSPAVQFRSGQFSSVQTRYPIRFGTAFRQGWYPREYAEGSGLTILLRSSVLLRFRSQTAHQDTADVIELLHEAPLQPQPQSVPTKLMVLSHTKCWWMQWTTHGSGPQVVGPVYLGLGPLSSAVCVPSSSLRASEMVSQARKRSAKERK